MRIVIDIASLNTGGAERQTIALAGALQRRGHETLVIVNKTIRAFLRDIVDADISAVELRHESRWDARVLCDLCGILTRARPDVVICVGYNASLWGRAAALRMGAPVVVAEHSTHRRTRWDVKLTNHIFASRTDAVVACAHGQIPSLLEAGHIEDRITVVHNGVDAGLFRPDRVAGDTVRKELGIPRDAFVVTLPAAHRPEKRHDRFISMMEKLDRSGLSAWGLMPGAGPLVEESRRLASASQIASRLIVLGARDDMRAVYCASDIVVLLSDDVETFPMTFLEAQACAVPVVGYDTGGVASISGTSGIAVPEGDENLMVSSVLMLATDREMARGMGHAGRLFASTLSNGAMAERSKVS